MPRPVRKSNQRRYVGIDPGKAGGIARLRRDEIDLFKMPSTIADVCDLLLKLSGHEVSALIERVSAGGSDTGGEKGRMGATSAFTFGEGYGVLQAALICNEIPFERIQPVKWQAIYGLRKRTGETKTQKKNRHKAVAAELFPKITVTHWNADALLIAEYLRRLKEGELV